MRDMVTVHITHDLPIRVMALPYAARVEIRFGKAFPVALVVDRDALHRLGGAVAEGIDALASADEHTRGPR
ncbi:hypothetical protein FHR81_001196 [Actinoalloteichus hoggarensis]|uniref:Uncharacterized protein n=1 Tax=Actinoalloteichus hoggarensis TaxID=1470176 RepID=A0A221VZI3_9PSEU|nr:hypothetical protein [Actinoalloteichus hoggarensis]ASO18930.1 hypothetical protein AHOG_06390 [Actinoalloteichus hoggarensis]MBB5920166.1 hypothetical protein [Actinoalloteichus hoggarensis]